MFSFLILTAPVYHKLVCVSTKTSFAYGRQKRLLCWRRRGDFRAASQLAPRKHGRRSSLGALARLPVFSLAFSPFLCHRQREKRLPPAPGKPAHSFGLLPTFYEKKRTTCVRFFYMAEKRRLSRCFAACTSKTWSPFFAWSARTAPCFLTRLFSLILPPEAGEKAPSCAGVTGAFVRSPSNLIRKKRTTRVRFLYGGEEETRTPAPVTRPTPLAGAPRHQLEYFSVW